MSEDNLALMCCCETPSSSSSSSSSSSGVSSSSSSSSGAGGGGGGDVPGTIWYYIDEVFPTGDPALGIPVRHRGPYGPYPMFSVDPPISLEWLWFDGGAARWMLSENNPSEGPAGITVMQQTPGVSPVGLYVTVDTEMPMYLIGYEPSTSSGPPSGISSGISSSGP